MALASYQKQLFELHFTGGSGGDADLLIVYDQHDDDIYLCDYNGVYKNPGEAGDPPTGHAGDYSTYYQCHGTTGLRFLGNETAYPFATKVYVAEYASCPFVFNKIRIKVPLLIVGDDGTDSGSITISVENAQTTPVYSINGGTTQSSNVFSGLAAGNYTILVVDGSNRDQVIEPCHQPTHGAQNTGCNITM